MFFGELETTLVGAGSKTMRYKAMSDEKAPGAPGVLFLLTVGLIITTFVSVIIYPIAFQAIVGARGESVDIEKAVMSGFDERAFESGSLSVSYVRAQFSECVGTTVDISSLDDAHLLGWHGLGTPEDSYWSSLIGDITELCARTVVLSSASMADARDRNHTLGQMGLAPYSEGDWAELSLR